MKLPSIHYAGWERAAMRLLFALVVALHIPHQLAYADLPRPNGLARLLDLTFLLNASVYDPLRYAAYAALALYAARVWWSVTLPYVTVFCIAVGSIVNSQGAISHHLQIVSLVLLVQTAAHWSARLASQNPSEVVAEDRVIGWTQQAIAATYLVSGLTKLIGTSGAWILQSPLVALQVVKTNEQDFYDTLDPVRAGSGLAIAEWMVQHPLIVGGAMTAGLLLELGAPLLLLGRSWAAGYGLALIIFHETIHRVMKLHFAWNEYLLWIYVVNVPFWVYAAFRYLRRSPAAQPTSQR